MVYKKAQQNQRKQENAKKCQLLLISTITDFFRQNDLAFSIKCNEQDDLFRMQIISTMHFIKFWRKNNVVSPLLLDDQDLIPIKLPFAANTVQDLFPYYSNFQTNIMKCNPIFFYIIKISL